MRDRLATPGAGRRTQPPAARPQDQDVHAPNPSVGNPDTDLCVRFYLEPDSGFLLFIRVRFYNMSNTLETVFYLTISSIREQRSETIIHH